MFSTLFAISFTLWSSLSSLCISHFYSGMIGLLVSSLSLSLSCMIDWFSLWHLFPPSFSDSLLVRCVTGGEMKGIGLWFLAVSHHYLWERDQREREREAGLSDRKKLWSLSHSCVCVCVCLCVCCDYARFCSESQGKSGSSVCIVLTWRCASRPPTHTWRRPRIGFDNATPKESPLAHCESAAHMHNTHKNKLTNAFDFKGILIYNHTREICVLKEGLSLYTLLNHVTLSSKWTHPWYGCIPGHYVTTASERVHN